MFASLLRDLPRPPLDDDASSEAILDACLALQAEHGLKPVTDGGWPLHPGEPVAPRSVRSAGAGQPVGRAGSPIDPPAVAANQAAWSALTR